MLADLERLIRLQQLETSTADARRRIADRPRLVAELDARLVAAKQALDSTKQRLADSQAARRTIEKDLASVQGRLSKYKDQLMEVKTNREYQAMQKEIEVAQGEVRAFEDRVLEKMLEADELTAEVKKAEAAHKDEEKRIAAERRALDDEIARLEVQVDGAASVRQDLVDGIAPRALATFEQVLRVRKGVAVAEARDGVCALCHVRLRPQVFNEVRRNDSIIQCDSCQRILYFAGPAVQAAAPDAS